MGSTGRFRLRVERPLTIEVILTMSEALPPDLLERTTRAFGSEQKARRWLTRPHDAFDGDTPREVARTEDGRDRIYDVLGRIEHGVYG